MSQINIFDELSEQITVHIRTSSDNAHGDDWIENKQHRDYDLWYVTAGHIANLHRPLRVQEMASVASMSEKYFITFFKKAIGVTPGQYLFHLKMNKARDYIYKMDHSMKEIAALLGYPDAYSFSKAFKRFYQIAPSRFRE